MQPGRRRRINRCTTDERHGTGLLLPGGRRLPVHCNRVLAQVLHEHAEHPVDMVLVETCAGGGGSGTCPVRRTVDCERGGFRGQLRVDDLGEDLADVEQEIEVLGLLPARRSRGHQLSECLHLADEGRDVRQLRESPKGAPPVREADARQPARRPLCEQEGVVGGVEPHRYGRVLHALSGPCRSEGRQELQHQREIDVDRPLQFRQRADVACRLLEVRILLESFRCDHFPEQIDHPFTLAGDLHLGDRVVEQEAAVVG